MNWITVIWSMVAAACLTLTAVHGLVWFRQREARANLMFALLALATAGMAACELVMMYAAAPQEYGVRLRWFQVPVWLAVVSLAAFVHFHLRAGRAWLAWTAIGLRTVVLVVNFLSPTNVNYREITSLRRVPFLGEDVAVPIGPANPWMLLAQFSLLLLLVYVVDAAWAVLRRGDRRAAALVGGATVVFVTASTVQAILVFWGILPMPMTPSLFFTGLVMAMGYDLSSRVLRAAQIARELQKRDAEVARQRLELAHLSRVASLSEFSGSLAHELNQPLAIILSNAQAAQRLLAQQPPDLAEVRDILADIVAEDRRAGDVIKRLRAFLKRGEPERHPLSLNEVVGNVLALMRGELVSRGMEVDLNLTENLPLISGDRIPLEQVVLNLVTNACDAMAEAPAGKRRLSMATHRDGADVRLSVCDAGGGLPPEPARVFDPFYTTKSNGLGMGLTICRTIVTAHGGRLWAEANTGPGATFHVALPAVEPIA